MNERDLTIFSTGSYQLSQAVSHSKEMLNKDGKLTIEYVKEEPNVLKFKYIPDRLLEHHIDVL